MIGDPHLFTSLDEEADGQDRITFGDNSKGKVEGLGKVTISNDHSISNVLYVASLSFNLLYVGQWEEAGRLLLQGIWLQMLDLQEAATPREVSKTL